MHLTAGFARRLTPGGPPMPSTPHTLLARHAAAGVLSLLLGLTAAPAEADDLRVVDGRADMWRLTGKQQFTPAPTVTNGDIVRTRFRHSPNRVVIVSSFARLTRHDFAYVARTRDNADRRRIVHLQADRRHPAGTVELFRPPGAEIPCATRHRISYRTDKLRISFPRHCIGNPRWLRFASWSIHKTQPRHYYDDANSAGPPIPPVWSPRVVSD